MEVVDPRDRGVQEPEPVLAALDLQGRVRGAVDGEDVAHEALVRHVLVERLAPPLRVRARVARGRELRVVDVVVLGDPVIEAAVEEGQRDVVVDVEAAVGVVGAHPGQPQATALVAHVHPVLRVIDGVEADHALVDVGPGVVHPVVVEPEEALLLPVIATGRPVQVQVVHRHPRPVALALRAVPHRVVRVAVALRGGVAVVQVGQERQVRRAEVLPVQAQWVLVEVVLEPDQGRLAVLGVDHRAREGAVEAVDRARRQRPLLAGRVGDHTAHAGPLERGRRVAPFESIGSTCEVVNACVRVRVSILYTIGSGDPIWLGQIWCCWLPSEFCWPRPGPRRVLPGGVLTLGHRCQRAWHRQRVGERREDQRTGREQLEIEHVRQHVGSRGERRRPTESRPDSPARV